MNGVFDLFQQTEFFHFGNDQFACLEPIQTTIFFRRVIIDARMIIHDVDFFEIIAFADFKVVEIMRWGDFNGARSLFRIGIFIGNDFDAASHDWQNAVLTNQILVTFIIRMNRNTGITQHGFRPRGRNGDELAFLALNRVFEVPIMAFDFFLNDFKIGNRGQKFRVPVDQTLVTVNQSLFVQGNKYLANSSRQTIVHGKAFTWPIW